MTQSNKTPKSSVLLLVAGFGVGALGTASILSNKVTGGAFGQTLSSNQQNARMRTIGQPNVESMTALHNLDASYANLADFVSPAVVDIQTGSGREQDASGARAPSRSSEGSGFIFRQDGYIITNDHVVGDAAKVKVILKDGREYTGSVIRATDSDLALVKIDATGLPTLAFGDSNKVRAGQQVMAAGAPFGMQQSVTFGHVSALNRNSAAAGGAGGGTFRVYADLIQTDTPINMGNSGGPLVDIDGRVVGVNTLIYSPSGVSAGIGFAIPSNQVKFISDMLVSKGKITRSMLGLVPVNLKEYRLHEMNIQGGALVDNVQPKSPAADAGIVKGDVIVRIGNMDVRNELDLRNAMLLNAPGSSVNVDFIRGSDRKSVSVKLKEWQAPKEMKSQEDLQLPDDSRSGPDFFSDPNRSRRNNPNAAPNTGKVRLGVGVTDVTDEIQSAFHIPSGTSGAVVGTVEPGSVAQANDLRAGDVIQSFNGMTIKTANDLTSALKGLKWGDKVRIKTARYSNGAQMVQERDIVLK